MNSIILAKINEMSSKDVNKQLKEYSDKYNQFFSQDLLDHAKIAMITTHDKMLNDIRKNFGK